MPEPLLDRIDLRILDLLQQDGRLSNQEIAERVALSPSPCLRRIRRLEQIGVIRRYAALLDPQRVGLGLLAYVNVKLEKRGKMPMEEFGARVQAWPEVSACYAMTGDMDYLVHVIARDVEHLSQITLKALVRIPGVRDVKSIIVLETVKQTRALPLE